MASKPLYAFEKMDKKYARNRDGMSEGQARVLMQRLLVDCALFADDELIARYVVSNHGAVEWYLGEIKRIRRWRRFYFFGTLVLLIVIPIAIYAGPLMLPKISSAFSLPQISDATTVTAQITVLLTALFGAHRTVSTWMEKRAGISHFWEASAKLKSNIFDLEHKWRGRAVIGDQLADAFSIRYFARSA